MAPSPLSATTRYIAPEVTKFYWVPAVADISAPTRVEIDAGTDLTGETADIGSWQVAADRVAVPDLGSKKTGRISGRVNPADTQSAFYASQDTADVRDLLARGDAGYIMICDGGDVTGQKARVFQVEVSSVTPTVGVAGTEGERIMIDWSINDWDEEVTIPA